MKCTDKTELDFWVIQPEELLNFPDDHWVMQAVNSGQLYSVMPKHLDEKWKIVVNYLGGSLHGSSGDVLVKHPGNILMVYNIIDFYNRFEIVPRKEFIHVDDKGE